MIVDHEWMAVRFARFNAESFGGELPTPVFRLSKARTRMGSCSWKARIGLFRPRVSDYTISMSTYYDFTERQACEVLLHEMIHYALALGHVRDTSAHGRRFREEAGRLNRKYGLHITAMAPAGDYRVSSVGARRTPHDSLVLALRMTDGRCYVSRIQPGALPRLERELRRQGGVLSHHWYVTTEQHFVRLPQHRTLRGYLVAPAELERMERLAAQGEWKEIAPGERVRRARSR